MTNPLAFPFWRDEEARLWAEAEPLVAAALLAGAEGGLRVLPPAIAQRVNWDFVNRSAQRFLQRYRLETVGNINRTTREVAIRKINQWLEEGGTMPELKRELRPLFGKTRADAIASTEVTRVFAAGNQSLFESVGVVQAKIYRTAADSRVCPICGPLNGTIVELRGDFALDVDTIANSEQMRQLGLTGDDALRRARQLVNNLGTSHPFPPLHPRCRCWIAPQVSEALLREQIGDILAQEFFAQVVSGKYDVVVTA